MIGMVADKDWSIPSKNIYTKFEDGTINYHGIIGNFIYLYLFIFLINSIIFMFIYFCIFLS